MAIGLLAVCSGQTLPQQEFPRHDRDQEISRMRDREMPVWRLMLLPAMLLVRGEIGSLLSIAAILPAGLAMVRLPAMQPALLEKPYAGELFAAGTVLCAGMMAARALAQAGFSPLRRPRASLALAPEC